MQMPDYAEKIKQNKSAYKRYLYDEIVFKPVYNQNMDGAENAKLNILGYFLVLPLAKYQGDFKMLFQDPIFDRNNYFANTCSELEMIMQEVSKSDFPIYLLDDGQKKLCKLNPQKLIAIIYESRKEKLLKNNTNSEYLEDMFKTCTENIKNKNLLAIHKVYPPLIKENNIFEKLKTKKIKTYWHY
jgi:hypothetical protein